MFETGVMCNNRFFSWDCRLRLLNLAIDMSLWMALSSSDFSGVGLCPVYSFVEGFVRTLTKYSSYWSRSHDLVSKLMNSVDVSTTYSKFFHKRIV